MWLKRRRARRDHWYAQQRDHQVLVDAALAGAGFHSWRSFYDGDASRQSNEVSLREIDDGEFRWRIIWFPTTEVVAWPFRWRDERWHHAVRGSTWLRSPVPSGKALVPAPLPEMIYVVGKAESADRGRERTADAVSLAAIRTALA